MPMGLVSDDEFTSEFLSICDEAAPNSPVRGRGNTKQIPETMRALVAESVINGEPVKEVSEVFGISPSSISAYKNSSNSTASYHTPVSELLAKNNRVREIIGKKSKRILIRAMNAITDEKLADSKAIELATIARNMGSVMNDMIPKIEVNNITNQTLVYRPRAKDEDEFDVIEVDT